MLTSRGLFILNEMPQKIQQLRFISYLKTQSNLC